MFFRLSLKNLFRRNQSDPMEEPFASCRDEEDSESRLGRSGQRWPVLAFAPGPAEGYEFAGVERSGYGRSRGCQ